jgi:hypothetical protein
MRSRVELKALTCEGADPKFLDTLGAMGIETYRVPRRGSGGLRMCLLLRISIPML